jgi:hypothetical protein
VGTRSIGLDDRLDGGPPLELAFDLRRDAALLTCGKDYPIADELLRHGERRKGPTGDKQQGTLFAGLAGWQRRPTPVNAS